MVNFLNIEKKKERQKRIIQIILIFLSSILFFGIIVGLIYGAILDAEYFKREEIHKDNNTRI